MDCPCKNHGTPSDAENRKMHTGTTCVLEGRSFERLAHDTCCVMNGTPAAHDLQALAQGYLAEQMYRNMTAEQAVAFADKLLATADSLEKSERASDCDDCEDCQDGCNEHELEENAPSGSVVFVTWSTSEQCWKDGSTFGFLAALGHIREAAKWYLAVGSQGFAVKAE